MRLTAIALALLALAAFWPIAPAADADELTVLFPTPSASFGWGDVVVVQLPAGARGGQAELFLDGESFSKAFPFPTSERVRFSSNLSEWLPEGPHTLQVRYEDPLRPLSSRLSSVVPFTIVPERLPTAIVVDAFATPTSLVVRGARIGDSDGSIDVHLSTPYGYDALYGVQDEFELHVAPYEAPVADFDAELLLVDPVANTTRVVPVHFTFSPEPVERILFDDVFTTSAGELRFPVPAGHDLVVYACVWTGAACDHFGGGYSTVVLRGTGICASTPFVSLEPCTMPAYEEDDDVIVDWATVSPLRVTVVGVSR